ncbi:MAG: FAD-binding oxidoreductase [Acidimicrobiales bacterium]
MRGFIQRLSDIAGPDNVIADVGLERDETHDEALNMPAVRPLALIRPGSTAEVAATVRAAIDHRVPLTARGSGTGLSGGCIPVDGGVVVSFERMNKIVEIDTANHVAVVEPGVTLAQLDDALLPLGFVYPVFPGEQSGSLGGNVATNAGGMRAVKYGVTRHHVLGLEMVLGTGEVVRSGGKFVKSTSGYDLTQLVTGSEGTLALVTQAILRLHPRPGHHATLLAPFATIGDLARSIPPILASGLRPMLVEYIDLVSMAGITSAAGIDLGISEEIRNSALAYLVVVLEEHESDRLEADADSLGRQLAELGALEVYVLPRLAGTQLVAARERAFWAAKAAGANDIVDVVVPRASIPEYLEAVAALASRTASLVVGCGHAGDGNVHLSIWQADATVREAVLHEIVATGVSMGGAVSGEHGIGTAKKELLAAVEDPAKIALWRRIKAAFDPYGILNPGTIFDAQPAEDLNLLSTPERSGQ